jgi:hypothetical protein
MNSRRRRQIEDMAASLGLKLVELRDTNGGHIMAVFEKEGGGTLRYYMPSTTGDNKRGMLNAERDIARWRDRDSV